MMSRMIAGAAMTSILAIVGCSSGGDPSTGTGTSASVTVAPETEGTLTVTSGAQAGSYHVKNVDIKGLGFPGGDGSYDMNFTIARAD